MLQAKTADMQHGKDIEPLLRSYFTSAEIKNWWNKLNRDISNEGGSVERVWGPFRRWGGAAARNINNNMYCASIRPNLPSRLSLPNKSQLDIIM